LQQGLKQYEFLQQQLQTCETQIEACLQTLVTHVDVDTPPPAPARKRRARQRHAPDFDVHGYLTAMTGVDLTQIDGIDALTALKVISEIGLDMTRWPTGKHFASWLGLCPGNKVSGGKRSRMRSKPTAHRAASALRLAA
jgi:transposase